ncbi:hypothetical protein ACU19_09620 [Actinobaculum suis]|nr:hypothetical protein ACU19_09620 [Actinobaculum suis]
MARSGLEKEFLDIGDGAVNFVRHAAQAGVTHLKDRLELICAMKGAWSTSQLNQALNTAAQAGRLCQVVCVWRWCLLVGMSWDYPCFVDTGLEGLPVVLIPWEDVSYEWEEKAVYP